MVAPMRLEKFSICVKLVINSVIVMHNLLLPNILYCMDQRASNPSDIPLLQAIETNNWKLIRSYIFDSNEALSIEAPENQLTYIEHALKQYSSSNGEKEKEWKWLINQLIYYGFPLPKTQLVQEQLKNILPEILRLAVLGKVEELQANLQQAKKSGETPDLFSLNQVVEYAGAQRQKTIVEVLIRHGADPYAVSEHLTVLKKRPFYKKDTKEEFTKIERAAFSIFSSST
jgi:hypothetical protein